MFYTVHSMTKGHLVCKKCFWGNRQSSSLADLTTYLLYLHYQVQVLYYYY